jgi:anti-anti-sigma regulatory factor
MRTTGVVDRAAGFGTHDHLCWLYHDLADFQAAAVEFLADGISLGQRTAYIGDRGSGPVLAALSAEHDVDDLFGSGALAVGPIAGRYGPSGPEADVQVEAYEDETRWAVAEGYSGFRVVAEATPLVRDVADRLEFERYEHRVDQLMEQEPFAAMCGYDLDQIGRRGAMVLAAAHPAVHGPPDAAPFRLYVTGSRLVLAGEVDAFASDALERALHNVVGADLTVDIAEVSFIDHRGVEALARHAQAGGSVTVQGARPVIRRLAALVGADLDFVPEPDR